MATPTEGYPEWGTNEIVETVDGKTFSSRVAPPTEVKNSGLLYQEPAARAWINYQFNLIRKWVEEFDVRTTGGSVQIGWFHYVDTQYTEGSPFVVNAGNTVALPNNAGTIISDGAPTNGDTFYDGTNITPTNSGDAYSMSVRMKVKSSVNDGSFVLRLNIGNGSPEFIVGDSRRLVRGANTEQIVTFDFTFFTLDTFVANGGQLEIEAVDGNISFYGINYMIQRTYYKDNA